MKLFKGLWKKFTTVTTDGDNLLSGRFKGFRESIARTSGTIHLTSPLRRASHLKVNNLVSDADIYDSKVEAKNDITINKGGQICNSSEVTAGHDLHSEGNIHQSTVTTGNDLTTKGKASHATLTAGNDLTAENTWFSILTANNDLTVKESAGSNLIAGGTVKATAINATSVKSKFAQIGRMLNGSYVEAKLMAKARGIGYSTLKSGYLAATYNLTKNSRIVSPNLHVAGTVEDSILIYKDLDVAERSDHKDKAPHVLSKCLMMKHLCNGFFKVMKTNKDTVGSHEELDKLDYVLIDLNDENPIEKALGNRAVMAEITQEDIYAMQESIDDMMNSSTVKSVTCTPLMPNQGTIIKGIGANLSNQGR